MIGHPHHALWQLLENGNESIIKLEQSPSTEEIKHQPITNRQTSVTSEIVHDTDTETERDSSANDDTGTDEKDFDTDSEENKL